MNREVNLIINSKDARKQWGVVTTSNTLSALLAPPSMKSRATFDSRLEDGIRIDTSSPKVAQRDISIEIQMTAQSPEDFYARHAAFCEELQKEEFELYTTDRPDVVYRFVYNSCPQFTQFCRGIATLALKVTEPNPKNRQPDESES